MVARRRVNRDVLNRNSTLLSGKYVIDQAISFGRNSVIYSVTSGSERLVAKEYFPREWATRRNDGYIEAKGNRQEEFNQGKDGFRQEGAILDLIRHPNVVSLHEVFEDNGTQYIILEHCGKRLDAYWFTFKKSAKPDLEIEKAALALVEPILSALEEIHARKVIHCDIHPGNIHVKTDNKVTPFLLDFGSARFLGEDSRNARLARTYTPGYSSPEQEGLTQALGLQADVYSSGATLYYLLLGEPPPSARMRGGDRDVVADRLTDYKGSRHVKDALKGALAVNPGERTQKPRDFLELLRLTGTTTTVYSPEDDDVVVRFGRLFKRLILSGAALLALVVTLMWFFAAIEARSRPRRPAQAVGAVRPVDFYILRDISATVSDRNFELIETRLRQMIRSDDGLDGEADFVSYAHFAEKATSGEGQEASLRAANRGDTIDDIKGQLRKWRAPDGFRGKTNFGNVFLQLTEILRPSKGRGVGRSAVVVLLTDGVSDPSNTRGVCPPTGEDFFDETTKSNLKTLMETEGVELAVFLTGGAHRCSTEVAKAWESLQKEVLVGGSRIHIAAITGYEGGVVADMVAVKIEGAVEKALAAVGRWPFVSLRPEEAVLEDSERENFDKREEFGIGLIAQGHLARRMGVKVTSAELLDTNGNLMSPLVIRDKVEMRVESVAGERNGPEVRGELRVSFPIGVKVDRRRTYQIRLSAEGEMYADVASQGRREIEVKSEMVRIWTSERIHGKEIRTRKLMWLMGASWGLAILFCGAMISYPRMNRDSQIRKIIREIVVLRIFYWALAFGILGIGLGILALIVVPTGLEGVFLLLVGIGVIVTLLSTRARRKADEGVPELGRRGLALTILDAIPGPLISLIVKFATTLS